MFNKLIFALGLLVFSVVTIAQEAPPPVPPAIPTLAEEILVMKIQMGAMNQYLGTLTERLNYDEYVIRSLQQQLEPGIIQESTEPNQL